jgi:homoserine/homoserine lactone efflux protein
MDTTVWLALFAAAWAMSLSPGPGALAAMSAGMNHGFRRGYFTTVGLVLGLWFQIAVVGLGVGALLAASGTLFEVVRWTGVAYLVWIGVQQWRAPATPAGPVAARAQPVPRRRMVARGFAVNATNPKGTVFMLAVVPQFLDAAAPLWPQYLIIGLTLSLTDLVVMAGYTGLASRVLATLRSPAHVRAMNRTFGLLFVIAGVLLANFRRQGLP